MKNIIGIAAIAIVLFSCKKQDNENKEIQKESTRYPVSFSTGFSESTKDLRTRLSEDQLPAKYASYIYYQLYKDGQFIKTIKQVKDSTENFGLIKDSLVNGRYDAVFFASKRPLKFKTGTFQNSYIEDYSDNDIFFTRTGFNIGYGSYQEQMSLVRILGKLTFNLKDLIPSNVTKVKISRNAAAHYYFSEQNPATSTQEKIFTFPNGHAPVAIEPFSLPTVERFEFVTADITAYDAEGIIVGQKSIVFTPERNRETIITGYLFNPYNNFTFLVNDEWDPDKDVIKWW